MAFTAPTKTDAALERMYHACLFPLDFIPNLSQLDFIPEQKMGEAYRLFRMLDEPLKLGSLETTVVPIILEVVGQIAVQDCFLSARSDRAYEKLEDTSAPGVVSFWIEPRTGLSCRIQWQRYLSSLCSLVEHTGDVHVPTSTLFANDPVGGPRIRVFCTTACGHEVSTAAPSRQGFI